MVVAQMPPGLEERPDRGRLYRVELGDLLPAFLGRHPREVERSALRVHVGHVAAGAAAAPARPLEAKKKEASVFEGKPPPPENANSDVAEGAMPLWAASRCEHEARFVLIEQVGHRGEHPVLGHATGRVGALVAG